MDLNIVLNRQWDFTADVKCILQIYLGKKKYLFYTKPHIYLCPKTKSYLTSSGGQNTQQPYTEIWYNFIPTCSKANINLLRIFFMFFFCFIFLSQIILLTNNFKLIYCLFVLFFFYIKLHLKLTFSIVNYVLLRIIFWSKNSSHNYCQRFCYNVGFCEKAAKSIYVVHVMFY